MADLWTCIRVSADNRKPGRLEIQSMFLERSRDLPLDVSIDLDGDRSDQSSYYDSDSESENSDEDRPGGRVATQGAQIFPTMWRWRSLSIRNLDMSLHQEFLEPIWNGRAPNLERLSMEAHPDWDHNSSSGGMPVFKLGAPKLREIRLRQLPLFFPQCDFITTLIYEDPVDFHVFKQIEYSSPSLVELKFKGYMFDLVWPDQYSHPDPVELPSLRRLTLRLDELDYAGDLSILLHSLRAPLLEALTVHFGYNSTFYLLDDALNQPAVASSYTPVRSLSLEEAHFAKLDVASITARFPSITHVSFVDCKDMRLFFQHLLYPTGVRDGLYESTEVAWPLLQSICMTAATDADTDLISRIFSDRNARGLPLVSWAKGPNSWNYLQKKWESVL
ncbi:hypothetical protein HWV62_30961 [Athelia sp. TMB]|nr:hypothetical protein HWV62_30961 [Athelia sp. TMB]